MKILIMLVVLPMLCSNVVFAKGGVLSERDFRKLEAVHQLLNDNKVEEAQSRLQKMLARKNSHYTQALFLQTAAHIAIKQDHYKNAIQYLVEVIKLKALPDYVEQNIKYNLTQLYAQESDYKNSLKMLKNWMIANLKITPDIHIFAATIYAHEKQYTTAIKHVKKAIAQSDHLVESWYQMLIAFHLQQKQYRKTIAVYQTLIKHFPKKVIYWKQLSGLYMQIKETQQALSVLKLANDQGLIVEPSDIHRLANLYLYLNIPYQAALFLQKKLTTTMLASSTKNWAKLADSWILAKEYGNGINALSKAASLEKKHGRYEVKMGRLQMENGQWDQALALFNMGIKKGGLEKKMQGQVYLLKGISAYYSHQPKLAIKAFKKAKTYDAERKKADSWLRLFD